MSPDLDYLDARLQELELRLQRIENALRERRPRAMYVGLAIWPFDWVPL